MAKVTEVQLEYLKEKLDNIMHEKEKKTKAELAEEAYQWLVKHPFKIIKLNLNIIWQ